MWIVNVALRKPYTFIVMAMLIILATPLTLMRMATDIFPDINIPIISIVWNYNGLSANEMASRFTSVNERGLTTLVNDIEHIESQTLAGIAVIKIFFQPNANIQTAIAQVTAVEQTVLRALPPGSIPPNIIKYTASSIPVIQLGLSSPVMAEQGIFDTAINFLRPRLITVRGAAIPYPYGGKQRVISVDLDTDALQAKGLTPSDVVSAINAQNLILPGGTAKIGETEYTINLNGSPSTIEGLNRLPIRASNGANIYLSDIGNVRDGFSPQTNVSRQDGRRGVLLSVLKNGGASTLDIVTKLKELLPVISQSMPQDLKITPLFDQSLFVKAAIEGVIREALIAACLTAAMILLFLGNWRSTCIIAVSIPLSVLSSILMLFALGETINLMTLGGLALAVGILVDDATVTIENIERHMQMGKELEAAILEGAGEIAVPALVSTLCICIVFVPMFLLTGVARYLFVPLAESVVFAMMASYVLSRTLVPTMVMLMMRGHDHLAARPDEAHFFQNLYYKFDSAFERFRGNYVVILSTLLPRRKNFIIGFLGFCLLSCGLFTVVGQDFFPGVDAGLIRLHFRAPTGTRIEETARYADAIEREIRRIVPEKDLGTILDNLGLPYSGINLAYSNSGTIGTFDGEIQIALSADHAPTDLYVDQLRRELPELFPGIEIYFQPADIITQILNFGQPAAIDIQFSGSNILDNYRLASELQSKVKAIYGAVDVHILQRIDQPTKNLSMDRDQLLQLGLSPTNVAQNMLVSLSGSFQTAPAFWLDPKNGVVYNVAVQTPQYKVDSIDRLLETPVNASNADTSKTQILGNLVDVKPEHQQALVTHYNITPAVDLFVSVSGRDLGAVAFEVNKAIEEIRPKLPKGTTINLRGQVETMQSSYLGLGLGLAGAIVLVYLLIVVNFQSWLDPFIIITALPAALAGIAWMLFLTRTPLSVPALTGAIMTMGVATANSILVVSFARERLLAGVPPLSAALEAGMTRIRPVMMTALAMIIGMLPMALGLGEGGEQNAPLGRATIGGLIFATFSTLFFVPMVFAGIHRWLANKKVMKLGSDGHRGGGGPGAGSAGGLSGGAGGGAGNGLGSINTLPPASLNPANPNN
jgi:multidrug efflux pump subunit AcrB